MLGKSPAEAEGTKMVLGQVSIIQQVTYYLYDVC